MDFLSFSNLTPSRNAHTFFEQAQKPEVLLWTTALVLFVLAYLYAGDLVRWMAEARMGETSPRALHRVEGSPKKRGARKESLMEEYARYLRPESWTDKVIVGVPVQPKSGHGIKPSLIRTKERDVERISDSAG